MISSNRLAEIVASTRAELASRRQMLSDMELESAANARRTHGERRSFIDALSAPGLSVIAEHKRSSPSAGVIRADLALEDVVGAYQRGGARAVSILTEGPSFGGTLDDLRAARAASMLPVLRKDFIVDSYQVLESVAAGADAILLIVAALDRDELGTLHAEAREHGLDVLVEVHDARELETAIAMGAEVIGVNNRDLTTLDVDTTRALELLPQVPPGVLTVAESGFDRRAQLDELERAGFHAVLVGEALMRAADVEAACRELTRA